MICNLFRNPEPDHCFPAAARLRRQRLWAAAWPLLSRSFLPKLFGCSSSLSGSKSKWDCSKPFKQYLSLPRLLLLLAAVPTGAMGEIPLAWNLESLHHMEAAGRNEGNEVMFTTTGRDPYIFFHAIPLGTRLEGDHILSFEYFCPQGIEDLEIFYGPPIRPAQSFSKGGLMKSEGWLPVSIDLKLQSSGQWNPSHRLLRLDLGRKSGIKIGLRNPMLRAPTERERQATAKADELRNEKEAKAERIAGYLSRSFSAKISEVHVTPSHVIIDGILPPATSRSPVLAECPPWIGSGDWSGVIPVHRFREQEPASSFTIETTRFQEGRDRLTSRWGLFRRTADDRWEPVSTLCYPTKIAPVPDHTIEPPKPASKKGLGGVWANGILEELVDLGIRHITANIWLSNLLRAEEKAGGPSFEHNGRTWWINEGEMAKHEKLIRFATENGMRVSAIVLVGFGDTGFAGQLSHPEADRAGHYAMPNLTSYEGVAAYEAAIHCLARRFGQKNDPQGRITHWILHNEIDYGWVWTNMGKQPGEVYLDTYVRSMRIVHNIARQFNPDAQVFISLTHHWDTNPDPSWKTYSPKRLLQLLANYSRAEGDFEWGVAYHPYPQSLFEPDTWNDTLPTFDFNTPMITLKNIEVLDAWMRTEAMQTQDRRVRTVLLSEQGFHTEDSSQKWEKLQAAAFVYAWHKIRPLETIEAFHNHRWIDHPEEGGLKLGIRTLPTEEKPYGEKKFAWETYKSLGTRHEKDQTSFAKEIIGVESFHEITVHEVKEE